MRVDGREVPVRGSLLPPLSRRTGDIIRVILATIAVITVFAASVITRSQWAALEQSISDIVTVLPTNVANIVYLVYGVAIVTLPFWILVGVVATRQWRLLAGYVTAGLIALIALSITEAGVVFPKWDLEEFAPSRLDSFSSQFLDDPRWIAMLAAIQTVASPWLPPKWRRAWWTLLLAFVPIHLLVSAVVPARSMFGLVVGWLVGSLVVWVVGTPALEVPLESVVRELGRHGYRTTALTVIRPAGQGPTMLAAACPPRPDVIVELYGSHQRTRGALAQVWRWLTFRSSENVALFGSMRRAVEHRALMSVAADRVGLSAHEPIALTQLERGWQLLIRSQSRGRTLDAVVAEDVDLPDVWHTVNRLHANQIAHGDLRATEIRLDGSRVQFDNFAWAELGPTESLKSSDHAQLLLTTAHVAGPGRAVSAAVDAVGKDAVIAATARLTRSALPTRVRKTVPDASKLMKSVRTEAQRVTDTESIRVAQVTRFSRNQIIQLVLIIGLVYVAYPTLIEAPTFVSEIGAANWWWGLFGIVVSALTYIGAAAALWACAMEQIRFRDLVWMEFANTFAATTTPAGVGGLALSVRFLQKGGLGAARATAAVALQQGVQVVTHVFLLIVLSFFAGRSTDVSHFVPSTTVLLLIGGVLLGVVGAVLLVPRLRHWVYAGVGKQAKDLFVEFGQLGRDPVRASLIIGGCAATTLGAAAVLWATVHAFDGDSSFLTCAIVTMIGGTLASAAPTPGGVGAVEAALIGGLTALGLDSQIAVPAVLLYRVITCWAPVLIGWPILRKFQRDDRV